MCWSIWLRTSGVTGVKRHLYDTFSSLFVFVSDWRDCVVNIFWRSPTHLELHFRSTVTLSCTPCTASSLLWYHGHYEKNQLQKCHFSESPPAVWYSWRKDFSSYRSLCENGFEKTFKGHEVILGPFFVLGLVIKKMCILIYLSKKMKYFSNHYLAVWN